MIDAGGRVSRAIAIAYFSGTGLAPLRKHVSIKRSVYSATIYSRKPACRNGAEGKREPRAADNDLLADRYIGYISAGLKSRLRNLQLQRISRRASACPSKSAAIS